ncbi:AAA family ATPase, partial [Candidatus Nitrosopelagicus sp.]|nr:AAA family ATPase [Candidatus Nitrosopelagicus sp.]
LAKMKNGEEGSGIGENILSQMLTEMEEGTTSRVVIIGITNRPDLIDSSMLRIGRLDLSVFVGPPDERGRLEIIKILTDSMPLSKNVDLNEIAVATQNYSGADLASLCREAAVEAMQNNTGEITSKDFATGLKKIKPSISKEVETWYEKIKESASSRIPREADRTFYG